MEFSVTIESSADGYTGTRVPGLREVFQDQIRHWPAGRSLDRHCPYCNHIGPQNAFWIEQQIEYVQSIARTYSDSLM